MSFSLNDFEISDQSLWSASYSDVEKCFEDASFGADCEAFIVRCLYCQNESVQNEALKYIESFLKSGYQYHNEDYVKEFIDALDNFIEFTLSNTDKEIDSNDEALCDKIESLLLFAEIARPISKDYGLTVSLSKAKSEDVKAALNNEAFAKRDDWINFLVQVIKLNKQHSNDALRRIIAILEDEGTDEEVVEQIVRKLVIIKLIVKDGIGLLISQVLKELNRHHYILIRVIKSIAIYKKKVPVTPQQLVEELTNMMDKRT